MDSAAPRSGQTLYLTVLLRKTTVNPLKSAKGSVGACTIATLTVLRGRCGY